MEKKKENDSRTVIPTVKSHPKTTNAQQKKNYKWRPIFKLFFFVASDKIMCVEKQI